MTENEGWRKRFRPDIPSTARIYDYLLGGKDNYPADRAAAEPIAQVLPNLRAACQWNRAFIGRAIRYLAVSRGVRQFIDVGAGLPTVRNVHEVAQGPAPGSRVGRYVDNDPVVLAHGRQSAARRVRYHDRGARLAPAGRDSGRPGTAGAN